MLLRHAKTERAEPGQRDRDRKLVKRGRADAPTLGAYMTHHDLIPDLVLVSPAARARETWDLVHEFALQLIASGDVEAREQLRDNLPTSGLVVMDLPIGDWAELRPHSARLERFVTPRLIAAATE